MSGSANTVLLESPTPHGASSLEEKLHPSLRSAKNPPHIPFVFDASTLWALWNFHAPDTPAASSPYFEQIPGVDVSSADVYEDIFLHIPPKSIKIVRARVVSRRRATFSSQLTAEMYNF